MFQFEGNQTSWKMQMPWQFLPSKRFALLWDTRRWNFFPLFLRQSMTSHLLLTSRCLEAPSLSLNMDQLSWWSKNPCFKNCERPQLFTWMGHSMLFQACSVNSTQCMLWLVAQWFLVLTSYFLPRLRRHTLICFSCCNNGALGFKIADWFRNGNCKIRATVIPQRIG